MTHQLMNEINSMFKLFDPSIRPTEKFVFGLFVSILNIELNYLFIIQVHWIINK